jgi:hypothetical protein
MSDLKILLIGIIIALIMTFTAGWYVGNGCAPKIIPGKPDTTLNVTKPDTCRDSSPKLPLIVTKPKKPHLSVSNLLGVAQADSSIKTDSTPISGGLVADFMVIQEPITYRTFKTYKNGDSVAVGATSRILPEIPPTDWYWTVERFSAGDTTRQINRIDTVHIGTPILRDWKTYGMLAAILAAILAATGHLR